LGGVTVFEMGLSLPWHKPILAKAVRTVYLRNAVIFQYNRLEAEQPPTQTSFSPSRTVCLVSLWGPHFGRILDRCAHTAHTQSTASVGPVHPVLGRLHGCNPSTACPSDRSTLHPCVAAACHLIHTRPPDIHVACLTYQRSLSNTYFSLGLRRPRSRNRLRALAITFTIYLPGFGCGRSDMSDR
jgi:hypothetical protein